MKKIYSLQNTNIEEYIQHKIFEHKNLKYRTKNLLSFLKRFQVSHKKTYTKMDKKNNIEQKPYM